MARPLLISARCDLWKTELVDDVAEVVGECAAEQAFDVLKDESLGLDFANRPHGLREHVAVVPVAVVLTAQREGLAGGTAGYEINAPFVGSKVVRADIALDDSPIASVPRSRAGVQPQGIAGVPVPFNECFVREARAAGTYRQPTRASEKL